MSGPFRDGAPTLIGVNGVSADGEQARWTCDPCGEWFPISTVRQRNTRRSSGFLGFVVNRGIGFHRPNDKASNCEAEDDGDTANGHS